MKELATTPAQLLQIAVDQGADLDKLEKLMELQERWEDREARKAYVNAMSEFRASVGNISRNRQGHNSKYADLAHTLNQVKDKLAANGLSHTWKTDQGENQLITVTCCVTHIQGHQECTSMSANPDTSGAKNSIQAIGSTITYLQRYTLFSLLGLASTDDDDGQLGGGEPIDDNQSANLAALLEEVGAKKDAFLKHFKIESIDDLPQKDFKRAVAMLEAKRKKA